MQSMGRESAFATILDIFGELKAHVNRDDRLQQSDWRHQVLFADRYFVHRRSVGPRVVRNFLELPMRAACARMVGVVDGGPCVGPIRASADCGSELFPDPGPRGPAGDDRGASQRAVQRAPGLSTLRPGVAEWAGE